jgi:hypothetical protein
VVAAFADIVWDPVPNIVMSLSLANFMSFLCLVKHQALKVCGVWKCSSTHS